MATIEKDFRVKKGLYVGDYVNALRGSVSAKNYYGNLFTLSAGGQLGTGSDVISGQDTLSFTATSGVNATVTDGNVDLNLQLNTCHFCIDAGSGQLSLVGAADDGNTDFGGGYGNTGVTITSSGNISADGDLTVDGTIYGGFGSCSVLFGGSQGEITSDPSNLFWNDSTDRLGIGTNTPTADLEVYNNTTDDVKIRIDSNSTGDAILEIDRQTSAGSSLIDFQDSSNATWTIGNSAGTDFHFIENGTDKRVTIKDGGNVGIGTSNPESLLHLIDPSSSTQLRLNQSGTNEALIGSGSNYFQIAVGTAGATNAFSITHASANVGINTTTPNEKLTVSGNISASGIVYADAFNSVTTGDSIDFNDDIDLDGNLTMTGQLSVERTGPMAIFDTGTTNDGRIEFKYNNTREGSLSVNSDSLSLIGDSGTDITICTDGNTNQLVVANGGNVGIGTNTPGEALDVVGNVQADEFIGELRGPVVFKAKAGEALTKGDVVYISGIDGNTTVVSKADADDSSKMPAFGLAHETVSLNAAVEITTFGSLTNFDTSAFPEGTELFVSTTAGELVSAAPTGESALIQKIAKVTRSDASAGSVKVMGAGRSNATPNLNEGRLFVGNSSNQAVADGTIHVDIANSRVGIGTTSPNGTLKVSETSGSFLFSSDTTGAGWGTVNSPKLMINGGDDSSAEQPSLILRNELTNVDWGLHLDSSDSDKLHIRRDTQDPYMTFTTGCNVGIGTTDPDSKLHIEGDSNTNAKITITNTAPATDNTWSIHANYNDQSLRFNGDSTNVMTLLDTGNVGVGTTDPTNAKLVVENSSTSSPVNNIELMGSSITDGGGTGIFFKGSSNTTANRFGAQIQSIRNATGSGGATDLTFSNETASGGGIAEHVRIQYDGNVGIGTTEPTEKLTVAGNVSACGTGTHIFESSDSSEEPNFRVVNHSTGDPAIRFNIAGIENYTVGIDNSDGDKFKIANGSALSSNPRLTINSDGDVGIGTTNPAGKVHIQSGLQTHTAVAGADDLIIENNDNAGITLASPGSCSGNLHFADGESGFSGFITYNHNGEYMGLGVAAGEKVRINSGGCVGVGTTAPCSLFHSTGTGTFGSCDSTGTSLIICATNESGSSSNTSRLCMYGYENRGQGIFYRNVSYSGEEWFSGLPYTNGGSTGGFNHWQVGYDASGDQAEYQENAILTVTSLDGGEVGIGTTSPAAKLHVKDTEDVSLLVGSTSGCNAQLMLDGAADGDGAGGDYAIIRHASDGTLEFINNGTNGDYEFCTSTNNAVKIHQGGNVTIGRFTSANSRPLEVYSSSNCRSLQLIHENNSTQGAGLDFTHITTTPAVDDVLSEIRSIGSDSSGGSRVGTSIKSVVKGITTGAVDADIVLSPYCNNTANDVLYVTHDQLVGINTPTPNEELTVCGAVSATGDVYGWAYQFAKGGSTRGGNISLSNAGGDTNSNDVTITANDSTNSIVARAAQTIQFYTYCSSAYRERLRITNGGDVGINTSTPNEKLTVSGNISADGKLFAGTVDTNTGTADPNVLILNGSEIEQKDINAGVWDTSMSIVSGDLSTAGDSGTGTVNINSQSLTIAGTSNEIETSASGQTITVGLPDDVTITDCLTVSGAACVHGDLQTGANLSVTGNLTVHGTTVTQDVSAVLVEDPILKLANNNSADIVDIGFYGEYDDGATKYTGLIRDTSFTGTNPYVFFDGSTTDILSANESGVGKPTVANYADVYMGRLGVNTDDYSATTRVKFDLADDENVHIDGDGSVYVDIDRNSTSDDSKIRFQTNGTDDFELGTTAGGSCFHITDGSGDNYMNINGTNGQVCFPKSTSHYMYALNTSRSNTGSGCPDVHGGGNSLVLGIDSSTTGISINSSNNVGIGLASAACKLSVAGAVSASGNIDTTTCVVAPTAVIDGFEFHEYEGAATNGKALSIRTNNTAEGGVILRASDGSWRSTWYGDGGSCYGFLDSEWGAFDIRKDVGGHMYLNSGTACRVLTTNDEGDGNGINADCVDGLHASSFVRSDADDTKTGNLDFVDGRVLYGGAQSTYRSICSCASIYGAADTFESSSGLLGSLVLQSNAIASKPIIFVTGSTPSEKVRITGAGDVGIGTNSPETGLHVVNDSEPTVTFESTNAGSSGSRLSLYHNSATPANNDIITNLQFKGNDSGGTCRTAANIQAVAAHVNAASVDGDIRFRTSCEGTNEEVMRITHDRAVGIGTTSPTSKLQVVDSHFDLTSANKNGISIADDAFGIGLFTPALGFGYGGNFEAGIAGVYGTADNNQLGLMFFTHPSSTSTDDSVEAMRITHEGDVGIGTDDPESLLHLVASSTSTQLRLNQSGSVNDALLGSGTNYFQIGVGAAGATNALNIFHSSGNVGIGTTATDSRLHVTKSNAGDLGGQITIDNPASSTLGNQVELSFLTDSGACESGIRNGRIIVENTCASNGAAEMQFWNWDGASENQNMTIDSDGNVGIGTIDPTARLNVKSSGSTADQIAVTHSGNTVEIAQLGQSDNGNSAGVLLLKANTSHDKICLDACGTSYLNGGDVGIGTDSPTKNLEIAWSSSSTGLADNGLPSGSSGCGLLISNNDTGTDTYANIDFKANSADGRIAYQYKEANKGDFHFITDGQTGSWDPKMTIVNDGNVGIGTTDPGSILDVKSDGDAIIFGNENPGSGVASHRIAWDSSKVYICADTAGDAGSSGIGFSVDGTVCNFIDSSGYLGVGTTAPGARLHAYNGNSGATADSATDDLVIESNGHTGLSILTPDTHASAVVFGNASDNVGARIQWDGTSNNFSLGSHNAGDKVTIHSGNAVTAIEIDSDQNVTVSETLCATSLSAITVETPTLRVNGTSDTAIVIDDDSSTALVQYGGTSVYHSASGTLAGSASAAILTFPTADYRSAKVFIQSDVNNAQYEVAEMIVLHDGTDSYETEYGSITTGSSFCVTYTSRINGANVEVIATNSCGSASSSVVASVIELGNT